MENYELYIPGDRVTRNAVTGQYMKGNVPHNKGKHWSDYMGKRAQRRCVRGWQNILKHRGAPDPDMLARKTRTQVVAVGYKGNWLVFPSCTEAVQWVGSTASNISRCCRWNRDRHHGKNDYMTKGVRFYYENDNQWTGKIAQR